jgi:hypothetical protein
LAIWLKAHPGVNHALWRCAPPMTDTRSARGGGHSGCL